MPRDPSLKNISNGSKAPTADASAGYIDSWATRLGALAVVAVFESDLIEPLLSPKQNEILLRINQYDILLSTNQNETLGTANPEDFWEFFGQFGKFFSGFLESFKEYANILITDPFISIVFLTKLALCFYTIKAQIKYFDSVDHSRPESSRGQKLIRQLVVVSAMFVAGGLTFSVLQPTLRHLMNPYGMFGLGSVVLIIGLLWGFVLWWFGKPKPDSTPSSLRTHQRSILGPIGTEAIAAGLVWFMIRKRFRRDNAQSAQPEPPSPTSLDT